MKQGGPHCLEYARGSTCIALFLCIPRAEVLAGEIRELQREMADYNTLMDKLNTDTEVTTVLAECSSVSAFLAFVMLYFLLVCISLIPRLLSPSFTRNFIIQSKRAFKPTSPSSEG